MRLYLNCNEAITDIGRELKKCATTVHTQSYQNKNIANDPNFITKEIQAFEFCILDTSDKDSMPNVTLEWAKAEFKERMGDRPVNPGKAYLLRENVWNEFLVDDGIGGKKFDYTYSERIYWQKDAIINELRNKPETRQAILEIHNNMKDIDSMGGRRRIPCSLSYQYMIRDGKLDVIYIMRSTDFATHFQNDIWLADEIRNYIANQVGVAPGKFIMFASSLHIYRKDWELLTNY